jgi:hypothetical protein
MEIWKSAAEEWLRREEASPEHEAEACFAALFAVLPDAQPAAGFSARTARVAWCVRTRPRRIRSWSAIVAVVLAAVFGNPEAFAALTAVTGWLVFGASLAAAATVQVASGAVTALTWASIVVRTGGVVAGAALSQGAAVLATLAVTGATALYLMHRLLRGELTTRHPGPLCV